ncbi:MAG: hypothetical protein KGZ56_10290 [Dethiobacter sp.]|nr:hypothetical protein [Dethiobacter sp.]
MKIHTRIGSGILDSNNSKMPCKNARQANSGDLIPIGSERPAVLAWLVEGCRIWQVEGLREPGAVSLGVETFTIRCTMFQYNA